MDDKDILSDDLIGSSIIELDEITENKEIVKSVKVNQVRQATALHNYILFVKLLFIILLSMQNYIIKSCKNKLFWK